jgi:peptide/nickel transport system permease protein
MAGLAIFSFFVAACAFGPFVYRTAADAIDFTRANEGPTFEHPLGTNDRGEDMLARVLYGGRVSLAVGIVAMLLGVVLGTVIGAISGYFGGIIDTVLMRLTELLISLPQLPLLLLVVYFFRDALRDAVGIYAGTFLVMVSVLGGLQWMSVARLVRAAFLSIKTREYIEAAHCIGVPPLRMIVTHMLPNAASGIIVSGSLAVAGVILAESTLSFLGLGFPPDYPTWGRLLFDAKDLLAIAPHVVLIPGAMIFLTVLSINFIGDGLRDALDPRKS